ncbi:protein UXT homolog [Leptopilina heterotoma]|uniref:protein UXT homolog n=1 Tax=Leptopilina heterotoma TaxID=63436 RepID=UPI001CA99919|nr:protein UXT homolog [Leptopilina heterotoma]XP_043482961.1 protein UXT homolog [Leptopilina heterotoma]
MATSPEIQGKIIQFEAFINDRLRVDLTELEEKLNTKNSDLAEFIQLKCVINTWKDTEADKNGFKTKVEMGCGYFVQASVEDVQNILLHIGLNHYVEFSLDDALVVINVRIKLLEKQIENLRNQVSLTNAHIKLLLLGIGELQNKPSDS